MNKLLIENNAAAGQSQQQQSPKKKIGPYGVSVQTYSQIQQSNLITDELAQLAAISSSMIVRFQLGIEQVWNGTTFDWTTIDPIVKAINEAGLKAYAAFDIGSAIVKNGVCPTDNTLHELSNADAATFAAGVATHYTANTLGYHLECMEVGNEFFWNKCPNGTPAGQMTNAVYQAVKAVNTDILVIACALVDLHAVNVTNWFHNLFASTYNGQAFQADAVNFHAYGYSPSGCGQLIGILAAAQIARNQNGIFLTGNPTIPIWITETGYKQPKTQAPPCQPFIDRTVQAQFLTQSMEIGRLSNGLISAIFWYTLADTDNEYTIASKTQTYAAYTAFQQEVKAHPTWDTTKVPVELLPVDSFA